MASFTTALSLVLVFLLLHAVHPTRPSEEWGYVQVRPGANMFWWYYRSNNRDHNPASSWPIVLWLQGGPGGSGIGFGNFLEIGPLDAKHKPRKSTWLQSADLLFVDNPVGTGFSFVSDSDLLVHTDEEAGRDLTTLLKELFNGNGALGSGPLYIVAQSYGGKYAVSLGLSIVKATRAGELKLNLGGIALGNSWISPEDFALSSVSLLKDVSWLDENGVARSNRVARLVKKQIDKGQYDVARLTWLQLQGLIANSSNYVDFYNFMRDKSTFTLWFYGADRLEGLLNGAIREKLKIIPQDVKWQGESDIVYNAFHGDFMMPRIKEVDKLLAEGINITIYNGQLDVICSTKGAESWLQKLEWEGLEMFNSLERTPLYCGSEAGTKAFRKSYKNLRFYWILGAGHFVPADQPCIALKMLQEITGSPTSNP